MASYAPPRNMEKTKATTRLRESSPVLACAREF